MTASAVVVDAAGMEDVAAIADLERASMGTEAWTREQVTEELAAVRRVVRVVRGTDTIVAWCDLAAGPPDADLLRLTVHPASRRSGVAGRLLTSALASLPAGHERVLLEVAADNAAARALYDRHGFVEIARRTGYYRDGTDAVVMQLDSSGGHW